LTNIPYSSHHPVKPELFINRESELNDCVHYVLDNGINVNIYGPPGVGKTSFLYKLESEINHKKPETFVLYLPLLSYVESNTVNLSKLILLSIVESIWTKKLKREYSELLEYLKKPENVGDALDAEVKKLVKIFRILRPSASNSRIENSSEVGAVLVAKATHTEKYGAGYELSELLPFEFSNLLGELIEILQKYSYDEIVLLADEANHLDLEVGVAILQQNFDILLDTRIKYVFVTFEKTTGASYVANKVFQESIALENFKNIATLHLLTDTYNKYINSNGGKALSFAGELLNEIWQNSQGNPKELQRLTGSAYMRALQSGSNSVELSHQK